MANKLTLPIEIGRRYVRRDGKVVTACSWDHELQLINVASTDGGHRVYACNGKVCPYSNTGHPCDLIADAPEESATYAITDYADVLRAIADGRHLEWLSDEGDWKPTTHKVALAAIADGSAGDAFRIKPDTITINGREVPAPVREAPKVGTKVWMQAAHSFDDDLSCWIYFENSQSHLNWLHRGLIHLTEDAARAHAEALLSFTRKD